MPNDTPNKLSKEDRATLVAGLDALIASQGRMEARESNPKIKEIRKQENERLVVLKNRLITQELSL